MKRIIAIFLLALFFLSCGYIGGDLAVKQWFRENLNDPNSLRVMDWGEKEAVGKYSADYARTVKYRAKNAFGGYTMRTTRFYVMEIINSVVYWEDQ